MTDAIGEAVSRWQDATQLFDEAVGARLGVSPSERRCLAFLATGPKAARDIAGETRLTPAAVTALVDRLEARDLVLRQADANDRRRVIVRLTQEAEELAHEYYGPIVAEGRKLLKRFTPGQLRTILEFVEGVRALQQKHTRKLSDGA